MNEMYLGQPPSSVVKWCKKKYQQTLPQPVPLTIQALKAFTDDDIIIGASKDAVVDFTVVCYATNGSFLGWCTFDELVGTSTKINLITRLKDAGIDVDSMKVAGARFEMHNIRNWGDEEDEGYVSISGQTIGCFQVYGSLNESFSLSNDYWTMRYMFQNNPTIAAVGITFEDDGNKIPYRFSSMFQNCTALKTCAATDKQDCSLKASFNYAYESAYESMFSGCTSLVNAPELPATKLALYCYFSMFNNCTSLVNAPELPATTLETQCYASMFYGCTSLVNAPELPATNITDNCYFSMFDDCLAVKELHYASAVENDSTFTDMDGSPKFGAENATVYFDL